MLLYLSDRLSQFHPISSRDPLPLVSSPVDSAASASPVPHTMASLLNAPLVDLEGWACLMIEFLRQIHVHSHSSGTLDGKKLAVSVGDLVYYSMIHILVYYSMIHIYAWIDLYRGRYLQPGPFTVLVYLVSFLSWHVLCPSLCCHCKSLS
jgi:hypothetical protein